MTLATAAPTAATSAAAPPAVELSDVRFAYRAGTDVVAIESLVIPRGETVFLHGPSGSGKTTLLGLLAGVLQADRGAVRILGTDITRLSSGERDAFRAQHLGYVFQQFNLIPYLSVRENILLPVRLDAARRARLGGADPVQAADALARDLDIAGAVQSKVTELSVGQQQRVAVARALIASPEVVICDEPTSALDSDRRTRFLELLFKSCTKAGATLVFVSHDLSLQPLFSRAVSLPTVNRASAVASVEN
jgi:putative ABC transport system ATP-binding protein